MNFKAAEANLLLFTYIFHRLMMEAYNNKRFSTEFAKIFISLWTLSIKLNNTFIFRYLDYEMLLIFLCGIKAGRGLLQQFAQLTAHLRAASGRLKDKWKVEWTFSFSSVSPHSFSFWTYVRSILCLLISFCTTLSQYFLYQLVLFLFLSLYNPEK